MLLVRLENLKLVGFQFCCVESRICRYTKLNTRVKGSVSERSGAEHKAFLAPAGAEPEEFLLRGAEPKSSRSRWSGILSPPELL